MLLTRQRCGSRKRESVYPVPAFAAPVTRRKLSGLILLAALLQCTGCNDAPQPQPTAPAPPTPAVQAEPSGDSSSAAADAQPVVVSGDTFQSEVLDSDQLVLVDVWAPWCGPCLQLAPAIEEIAAEYKGRVKVAKVNSDENPGVAGQYEVTALPTLLFFRNGRIVEKSVGLQPKRAITAQLDRLLAANE